MTWRLATWWRTTRDRRSLARARRARAALARIGGTQRHGLRRWRAGCRCPICCVARDHDAAMARVRKEGA